MKKETVIKACNGISGILLACFIVTTIADYRRYVTTLNSAPFSVWIMVNAMCFVLPAAIAFLIGIVIKRRNKEPLNKSSAA